MENHTPTPYRVNNQFDIYWNDVIIASTMMGKEQDKANAAFIVKACNNHGALVEALETCIFALNSAIDDTDTFEVGENNDCIKAIEQAHAALKAAKGE